MTELGVTFGPFLAAPEGVAALALGLLFVGVVVGVLGLGGLLAGPDPVRRRLAGDRPARAPARPRGTPSLRQRRQGAFGLRLPFRRSSLAGRGTGGGRLRALRVTLAVALPAGYLAPSLGASEPPALASAAPLAMGLGLAGAYLPRLWVERGAARRRRALADAFPDALDLMVICVEAGLGLDAAFTRVAGQIAPAHPALAAELAALVLELRAGKSRDEALHNLARRTGLPEVTSFVRLLVQSEALGTSVAQTLRVHAAEMRALRVLRAEELAHKLPVKLTIPLVACILPALLTALLLPGLITVLRVVLPGLAG